MEYRQLGHSGLKVPILTFGTGTFGGQTDFFKAWGASDVKEATRLVDVCLDAGLTMFDSADVYSQGQGVGAVVSSPLGWARLTGKIRRGQPAPEVSRLQDKTNADAAPPLAQEYLFTVVDAIDAVAKETGKTV